MRMDNQPMAWKSQPETVTAGWEEESPSEGIPSNAMHVKLRVNQSGPPDKAKYSLATDSEQVPRGKGEKNPGEGSEIDLTTTCLQCVGTRKSDGLPFA